jgi:hypothetical protein
MKTKFFQLLSVVAIATVSFNSCTTDACKDVDCGLYGECVDGDCVCDTGYEGVNCDTEMREKFAGNYLASEAACDVTDFASSIGNSSTGVNKIAITGFGGYECSGSPIVVIATVNGMDVTVDPNQSFCSGLIVISSGSGSINASGNVVSITYTSTVDGGTATTCTTVYTGV